MPVLAGKRYRKDAEKVDRKKRYEVPEAVALVKKLATTKFDQTVEIAMRLGVDVKKPDQMIRGTIALPKGIGKTRSVIVFAEGEDARIAKDAGADEAGGDELIKKVQEGWAAFDVAISIPAMMPKVGKLGKVLGPMGKMPSPKSGTVTTDLATAVKEFKAGKIEYRLDAHGNLHAPVGKCSFSEGDLRANVEAFVEHIKATKPSSVKGAFIMSATLSATMSPGIPLNVGV